MPNEYPRKYWWVVLIVVPILVAVIGGVFDRCGKDSASLQTTLSNETTTNTEEEKPDDIRQNEIKPTFEYLGRVIDKDSERPIRGAKVTFEFQGAPPVIYTDSEGIYSFPVAFTGNNTSARVRVEFKGYENFDRFITLSKEKRLEDIRLSKIKNDSTANQTYYDVTLILPEVMNGAEILVDNKPAIIPERALNVVKIRVKKKSTNHVITVRKGNKICQPLSIFIDEKTIRLEPCEEIMEKEK